MKPSRLRHNARHTTTSQRSERHAMASIHRHRAGRARRLFGALAPAAAQAPAKKPNILFIVSDDTGYGDLGPYGGGEGRGMPTPSIDRLAADGMTFFSFYAQPSCTPGRAAMQTGRIPNRSGMTTVAFQGQGGGLPAAEWTLASVLKQGGYQTYFTGKWHLGEADYALPNAQGYDEMKYVGPVPPERLHLRRPDLVPGHGSGAARDVREGDQGLAVRQGRREAGRGLQDQRPVRRQAGQERHAARRNYPKAWSAFPSSTATSRRRRWSSWTRRRSTGQAVLHQRQLHEGAPAEPAGAGVPAASRCRRPSTPTRSSSSTRASAASWTSCARSASTRTRWSFYTTDNGAWQDVYPDAGYTPFRGTKGTVREGGNRVPAIAVWPGRIKAGTQNHDIVGGLDLMATFAARRRREAAGEGPRRRADHLRQLRHDAGAVRHRQVGAQVLVLLHRERAVARRGARRQLQGGVQPARRQRRSRPAAWRSTPTSAGRARRSTSRRCRRSSTCGRTRRSATTSS